MGRFLSLLAVLLEAHAPGDLPEALATQPDVVLADETLLAPAALTGLQLARPLVFGLLGFTFAHSLTSTSKVDSTNATASSGSSRWFEGIDRDALSRLATR